MASVITTRRPNDPTPAEIEARKAEIDARRLAAFDATPSEAEHREQERLRVAAYRRRKANLALQQRDQSEPVDLDTLNFDNTPHLTVCGKVPVPAGGPVEMSAADRCGFELGSFFELNQGLDKIAREDRWTLGDVDPESVDLSAESLAEYRFAIAQPLPPLKTEWKPKPFKTKHEARPFRSSKGSAK